MRRRSRTRRILKWVGLVACALLIAAWMPVGWAIRYVEWHWGGSNFPQDVYSGYWIGGGGAGYIDYLSYKPSVGLSLGRPMESGLDIGWSEDIFDVRCWYCPAWIPLLLLALPTALLWHRDRRPPKGHCRNCGYNLTGNVSGVCPECGEATGEVPGDQATCHELTRSGMRTRLPKPMLIWWIAFLGLLVFLGVSICYGSSKHPVGMALSLAPFTAIFAFSISTAIARLSHRPVTVIDAIRIACWTGFGCAEGVGQMSASYYAHYWPQYSTLARTFAGSAMGFCLLVILFVTLCFPVHKPLGKPHCPHCNYDLTGNVTGVCPECGQTV
ncbi:MAG: hypothetical protein JXB13_08500 [Phycisphaerae bacterium]|nr:hypothetical protein [Phycisphaerae bacterium]